MSKVELVPKYSELLLKTFDKVYLQSMSHAEVAAAAKAYADGVMAAWGQLFGEPGVAPPVAPAVAPGTAPVPATPAAAPGTAPVPAAPAAASAPPVAAPAAKVAGAPFGEAFLKGWDEPALRLVLASVQGVVLCRNYGGTEAQLAEVQGELDKSIDALVEAQQKILLEKPPSPST